MLELAEHIIKTKSGAFDPSKFEDRYEAAVAELVKTKLAGKKIEARKEPKREKVVDLMDALRMSAGISGKKAAAKAPTKSRAARAVKATTAAPRRKAG
jgi:DNA end-binding protein Ku